MAAGGRTEGTGIGGALDKREGGPWVIGREPGGGGGATELRNADLSDESTRRDKPMSRLSSTRVSSSSSSPKSVLGSALTGFSTG